MRNVLTRFGDSSGAAAVEFAFAATILGAALVGLGDIANLTYHYTDMRSAVGSGAQYVMAGGRNLSSVKAVVQAAWNTSNGSSNVTVTNACTCAGASSPCTSLCPDNSVPQSFTQIQATVTYQGLVLQQPISVQTVVRTR